MKLQRWDPPRSFPTKALAWIPCDDGDWCYSDDVDVLEQRCAELLDELKSAHKFIHSITDVFGPYTYLNGTDIVQDAYKESSRIRWVIDGKPKSNDEELLERLEIMASQHYCGCGHTACKRCEDDKMNQEIINKVKESK